MSSKSTIILTNDNEHWYEESQSRYSEGTESESAIVLEFDAQHKFESDHDGLRVIIEEGTELYRMLIQAKFPIDQEFISPNQLAVKLSELEIKRNK